MKVLLSAYACAPNCGSEFRVGWNWALYLAKAGLEVFVLTRPHDYDAMTESLYHEKQNLKLVFYYVDVPAWSKKLLKGQTGIILHYLLWQREVFKFAINLPEEFDIVHHVSYGSIKGVTQLYKLSKPLIFGPIGGGQVAPPGFRTILGKSWAFEKIRKIINLYLLRLSPSTVFMMRRADLILATNKETAHLAERLGANNIDLFLDSGLSDDFLPKKFSVRKRCEVLKLLWVGKLIPRKAIHLALQVVKKSKVPIMLTIVGDGPLGKELEKIIDVDSELKSKVDWWGHIPWPHVRNAYLNSDVFLFTSLRDSFGSQLLEAMAFGLPIICLNHHGARDFIPDNAGIKITVSNLETTIENLVLAVEKLYNYPEMRTRMGAVGYKFALEQTWTKRANMMFKIYEKVLNS